MVFGLLFGWRTHWDYRCMTDWTNKTPEEILDQIGGLFGGISMSNPYTIFVSRRMSHHLKRLDMTKRQFRRWRGKQKEFLRKNPVVRNEATVDEFFVGP